MKSAVFSGNTARNIESKVKKLLNERADILSPATADSTRAAGDAMQGILEENFREILGDLAGKYSDNFARRAMADLAFEDKAGNYYVVDVKTHREDTAFNMPNLTSVDRLARFYEDDANYFVILMVKYAVKGTGVAVSQAHFLPIEHLKWSCLTIGALGKGQIQIANAKHLEFDTTASRKSWMLEFCDIMLDFYPREVRKIGLRIAQFEKAKTFWLAKKK
ncbi:MAG: hypothetical protein HYX71_12070 [Opitutae bacterium]|nr:hypothetical protein [Opitutae bacterium]